MNTNENASKSFFIEDLEKIGYKIDPLNKIVLEDVENFYFLNPVKIQNLIYQYFPEIFNSARTLSKIEDDFFAASVDLANVLNDYSELKSVISSTIGLHLPRFLDRSILEDLCIQIIFHEINDYLRGLIAQKDLNK